MLPSMQNTTKGDFLAILSIFSWACFPVALKLGSALSPLWMGSLSMVVSTVFFFIVIVMRRGRFRLSGADARKNMAIAILFNGVAYYALCFIGYRYTSSGNGAVLSLMEIFFSYLILSVFLRHEAFNPRQAFGAGLMLLGALIILLPGYDGFRGGDLLIFVACALPPIGNRAMQSLRRHVGSDVIMFWRSLFGSVFIVALAFAFENTPSFADLTGTAMWPVLINGILILGFSKILWLDSLHYIPITRAISFDAMLPVFTMIVAWFLLGENVTMLQLLSLPPLAIGLLILVRTKVELPEEI